MKILLVVLCVAVSVATAAPGNCFVLGAEGTSPFPPVGYSSVTLGALRGTALGDAFIAQYNSFGIPFISSILSVTNCLVSFGNLQCIVKNPDPTDYLVPFMFSGTRQCVWDNPSGPVDLGTWNSNTYYRTLNQSVFSTWTNVTCATINTHYTLLYNNSCGGQPTPTPTPPMGNSTCCYYFSHPENYQTFLCQRGGIPCPMVSGFVLVYNQTATSCAQCSLTSVPSAITQKHEAMASIYPEQSPDKE